MANSYPYADEPTHKVGTVDTGSRNTTTLSNEGRLKVDAEDRVFMLQQNRHPLTTLFTQVGKTLDGGTWKGSGIMKKVAVNPTFDWFEKMVGGRFAKVSGTYAASGDVTITVTGAGSSSGYIFTPGDVVLNSRTGERMVVDLTTVPTTTTIKVLSAKRAFGTTAAAAGADGDGLYIIGNVNEEGSGARNVNSTQSDKESNYTQIFKTTISETNTSANSDSYGGNDLKIERGVQALKHALDIEHAFIFGEKKVTTGAIGHPLRATGGVLEFLEAGNSYVQNQGGILTETDFDIFLREGFTYGNSPRKYFMCGGLVLQAIAGFAKGKLQMRTEEKSYGMTITEYTCPFGSINIVHNPMLVEDFAGYGMLLDLNSYKYRFIANRDTKLELNVQAPDVDGEVDQYVTECGLQRMLAANNALLKGVTA